MEVNISDYATGEVLSMTVRIDDRDQQYIYENLSIKQKETMKSIIQR